jgi:hypothetical protein
MATDLKGLTIASTYQDLVKRDSGTYSQTGMNIEIQNDSGTALATGLYLESGATTSNVGIGTDSPQTLLELGAVDNNPTITLKRMGGTISATHGLGNIDFVSVDADGTTDFDVGARIIASAAQTHDGANFGTDLSFWTADNTGSALTQRITIQDDGNVGIGVTAPSSLLHISHVSQPTFLIASTATSTSAMRTNLDMKDGNNDGWRMTCIADDSDQYLSFEAIAGGSHSTVMVLEDGGNVGIGVTAPGMALEVVGLGRFSAGCIMGADSTNNKIDDASSGAATAVLYIGNVTITTSSDKRLKTNIVDTESNGLEVVNKFRIVDFNWNDPSDQCINNRNARGTWTGFLAQEAVEVAPYSVNAPRPEGKEIDHDSENTWTMEYGQLVPILAKAIQELSAKVTALENA